MNSTKKKVFTAVKIIMVVILLQLIFAAPVFAMRTIGGAISLMTALAALIHGLLIPAQKLNSGKSHYHPG